MTFNRFNLKFKLAFFFIITYGNITAQHTKKVNDTIAENLSEITITSIITNKQKNNSIANVHFISELDLKNNNSFDYSPVLNSVPGVFMQTGALNTNRITIRGIGARSPFGTTAIRAYFGEIPLTDGNGGSAIEDMELASISEIEIHKGPAASSFGVGLGGTIILHPKKIEFNKSQANIYTTLGSFGLQKFVGNIAQGRNNSSFNLTYSDTKSDGFRENNEYRRKSITAVANHATNKNEVTFLGNFTDLKAFIPSSVNLATFEKNPEAAAPTWKAARGFEDAQTLLSGISWQHNFNSKLIWNSSIFTSVRNNYEPRPFNILQEQTNTYGIRTRISGKQNKLSWGLGTEFFWDQLKFSTLENLYQDFPEGTGSVEGSLLSKFRERRSYYNLFSEANYKLFKNLRIEAGINLNQTNYKLKDQFNGGSENKNGSFIFDPILSPKIGIRYQFSKNVTITGTIAHGFAPPTTEETLLPDGERNPNLKPEQGWNFETTTLFNLFNGKINGKVSLYTLKVSDLLVNRRAENDALFAINAGKTSHSGLEGELNYQIISKEKLRLSTRVNYSYYNYKFKNFIDEDSDFSGNQLTGVPSNVLNTSLNFETDFGLQLFTNFQYVDKIPADDANNVFSDSYKIVNFKANYTVPILKKLNLTLFSGIQNLFDTKYVSQLQVNAGSFGGRAPRYYYAGYPINFYGGINIQYVR